MYWYTRLNLTRNSLPVPRLRQVLLSTMHLVHFKEMHPGPPANPEPPHALQVTAAAAHPPLIHLFSNQSQTKDENDIKDIFSHKVRVKVNISNTIQNGVDFAYTVNLSLGDTTKNSHCLQNFHKNGHPAIQGPVPDPSRGLGPFRNLLPNRAHFQGVTRTPSRSRPPSSLRTLSCSVVQPELHHRSVKVGESLKIYVNFGGNVFSVGRLAPFTADSDLTRTWLYSFIFLFCVPKVARKAANLLLIPSVCVRVRSGCRLDGS
jgi:hypothetical protein